MDRLEQVQDKLGVCERCKQFKLLRFAYYQRETIRKLCIACAGAAAVYLHKQ